MNKYSITIAASIIVIAAVTGYVSHGLSQRPGYNTTTAQKADVTQGVSLDGTVQATQTLSLSFQTAGTVNQVNVAVGDQVKQGQVLAALLSTDAHAAVDQANATVQTAKANYAKVLAGATSQQVAVAQAAVTSAQTALANATSTYISTKSQQDTLVKNAYQNLLNTSITAIPGSNNLDNVSATVSGTYTGTAEGAYNITIYSTGNGLQFQTTGLENSSGNVRTSPIAMGADGLYIQFSGNPSTNDTWTVNIPNTYAQASSFLPTFTANEDAYLAAEQTENQTLNTAQDAINSAQAALTQAQANLQLTQSAARPEDVAAAEAQVATAQAALEAAQNNYTNTAITAPIDGTITEVDAKVGQTAAPGTPEIGLISNSKFQVIAYISSDDLSKINVGDNAPVSLDAYGSSVLFPATVISIDPTTTMNAGTAGYKVTLQFSADDARIKSGMAAHSVVADQTHSQVLAVPSSAVFTDNSQTFVLKVNGQQTIRQPVSVGFVGIDNMTEITSGLNEGDTVIDLGK